MEVVFLSALWFWLLNSAFQFMLQIQSLAILFRRFKRIHGGAVVLPEITDKFCW